MSLPYSVKMKQHDPCYEVRRTESKKGPAELKLAERGEDKLEKEINP
jgi:hypothetical protein